MTNPTLRNYQLSTAIFAASAFIGKHAAVLPIVSCGEGMFYGEIHTVDAMHYVDEFRSLEEIFSTVKNTVRSDARMVEFTAVFVSDSDENGPEVRVQVVLRVPAMPVKYDDISGPALIPAVPVDAWGRPVVTATDGHSAWACNDRHCQIHLPSLYGYPSAQAENTPADYSDSEWELEVPQIDDDVRAEALRLVHDGRKIMAIGLLRKRSGVSLMIAKRLVNAWALMRRDDSSA